MIISKGRFLQIVLLFIFTFSSSSTEQIKDKLIGANGELYDILRGYPLESYYNQNPGTRPDSEVLSTALWRRYVSYYKLSNKALYLVYVHYPETSSSYEIRRLPEEKKLAEMPVNSLKIADWYTGAIALSLRETNDEGKRLLLEFEIENGLVSNIYKTAFPKDLYVYIPPVNNASPPRSYSSFQHSVVIEDGKLSLLAYSPDADDYVLYYDSPMNIIEGRNYHTILSEERRGIVLQSDHLLLLYIGDISHPVFRGCDSSMGSSSDWVDGIKEVFYRENLRIGEEKILSPVYFDVKEIIFSSGVLDLDDPESYYAFARPRRIRINNNTTGELIEAELKDTAHFQSIGFAEAGPYELTFEVLTVYPGWKSEEIAINSILFKGE